MHRVDLSQTRAISSLLSRPCPLSRLAGINKLSDYRPARASRSLVTRNFSAIYPRESFPRLAPTFGRLTNIGAFQNAISAFGLSLLGHKRASYQSPTRMPRAFSIAVTAERKREEERSAERSLK